MHNQQGEAFAFVWADVGLGEAVFELADLVVFELGDEFGDAVLELLLFFGAAVGEVFLVLQGVAEDVVYGVGVGGRGVVIDGLGGGHAGVAAVAASE